MAITWAAARNWRLSRQYLNDGAADAVEVVGRLTTVPAWVGDPELAVALRLADPVPGGVQSALAEERLVRTYSFGGATHLLRPQDAGAIMALRAAGKQWERKSWQEHYELTPKNWPDLRALVREALADGPLTQAELAAVVTRTPRFAHLGTAFTHPSHTFLKPFAWQGDLVLGPSRDGKVTLRGLDGHPGWTGVVDLDEAGHRAIVDYLAAYGPATTDQLQYWFGQGLSAGRQRINRWIDELSDRLSLLEVDDDEVLCLQEHAQEIEAASATGSVHLIPGFDQWVRGPGTANTSVVPADLRPLATKGANLVLVDGLVQGSWRIGKHALELAPTSEAIDREALTAAANRVATLLGRTGVDILIED